MHYNYMNTYCLVCSLATTTQPQNTEPPTSTSGMFEHNNGDNNASANSINQINQIALFKQEQCTHMTIIVT